jgi:hypothetical protein
VLVLLVSLVFSTPDASHLPTTLPVRIPVLALTQLLMSIAIGDNVTASVLSQLEISTGIVACCTITYRPLIEKIFGRGKTRSDLAKNGTGVSSIKRNGWNKINVQHDVELLTSETVAKNGANFAIHERSID